MPFSCSTRPSGAELAPDQRAFLLYSRGVSYEALSLRDRALGDLDAAIALLPQFPNSYIYRALIWTDRREFDWARDDLMQALRLNPNNALIYNNLGSVYEHKAELDLAIENYGAAIRLDPAYAEAFYNHAHAFIAKQDYQAAIVDYDRAIALQKDFADAFSNRGGVYLMQGYAEKAIADSTKPYGCGKATPIFGATGQTPISLLVDTTKRSAISIAPKRSMRTMPRSIWGEVACAYMRTRLRRRSMTFRPPFVPDHRTRITRSGCT